MKKSNKNKLANYLIIALVVLIAVAIGRNWYISNKLKGESKSSIAIITKIQSGKGVKQISGIEYFYYVNGKRYSGSDNGDFNFMSIRDTVLIKYSVNDNSVSEVLNKYYMQKYKTLKEKK